MCVLNFPTSFVWSMCKSRKKRTRYSLHIKYSYSCPILIELEHSRWIFEKHSNIKFHENPSTESRVIPHGQTEGHTDTTKLTVAFRKFVNVPRKRREAAAQTWRDLFCIHVSQPPVKKFLLAQTFSSLLILQFWLPIAPPILPI